MSERHGSLSINSDNIFPIIKKWLYSDHDIFFRELISNGCDAITKLKKLDMMGEYELPEGYKGVSRVDSELKDMEMIAEMADGKLVVRPSRLVYDASVAMDVFDENGNLKTPNRKVVNSELDGYITFRLAVPKTVTEKYAQIVHKSAGYSDSSIRRRASAPLGTMRGRVYPNSVRRAHRYSLELAPALTIRARPILLAPFLHACAWYYIALK